jgi:hypothetical protein
MIWPLRFLTQQLERERDTDKASKSPSPKIISTFFSDTGCRVLSIFILLKKKDALGIVVCK